MKRVALTVTMEDEVGDDENLTIIENEMRDRVAEKFNVDVTSIEAEVVEE